MPDHGSERQVNCAATYDGVDQIGWELGSLEFHNSYALVFKKYVPRESF